MFKKKVSNFYSAYLCQQPLGTSSDSASSGLSSALISLLGDEGVVSDSDHAFALTGRLLAAVLGLLMANAVVGLDLPPETGLDETIPDIGLLFTPYFKQENHHYFKICC